MVDLAAYLARIELDGPPTLAAIHRAHATSIPFENLDSWSGKPVSLGLEEIERKLVQARQGGYCFEHNLLLGSALEQLGLKVDMLLGRSRTGGWPGPIRPRTHMALRVWVDGQPWLADVGFGFGGLLDPLPFAASGPHDQSGWRFRLVWDGPELVVQAARGEGWADQYGMLPDPVPLVDVETANWMASTYPGSPWVCGPIISATSAEGHRILIRGDSEHDFVLIEQNPTGRHTTPIEEVELSAILEERFALDGKRAPTHRRGRERVS